MYNLQDLIYKIKKDFGISATSKTLQSAILQCLNKTNYPTPEEYIMGLLKRYTHKEWQELLSVLVTSETYFFRNPQQLDCLEKNIMPEIIKTKRHLKVWSAGCSTGEEAYSLAIIMDSLQKQAYSFSYTIYATDLIEKFLEKAKEGLFSNNSFRRTEENWVKSYFQPAGNLYRINKDLKKQIIFQQLNLLDNLAVKHFIAAFAPFDLILCRNVLIYFDDNICEDIVKNFIAALDEKGVILFGAAEFVAKWTDNLKRVKFKHLDSHAITWQKVHHARELPTVTDRFSKKQVVTIPAPINMSVIEEQKSTDTKIIELFNSITEGNGLESISKIEELIEENDLLPEAYYLLGLALEAEDKPLAALTNYSKATFLDPDFTDAYWKKSLLLKSLGESKKAIKAAKNAYRSLIQNKKSDFVQRYQPTNLKKQIEDSLRWMEQQI